MNSQESQSGEAELRTDTGQLKKITTLVYVLQAASFFIGLTFIAAVIVNYIKKEDVQGTWLESHFRWQMRTFWFGLLWGILGGVTVLLAIGFVILGIDFVWIIYRIIKGWLRLTEGKEMYPAPLPGR